MKQVELKELCSRCKRELEDECICCKVHPSSQVSDLFRTKKLGNPDFWMDKGNINYMKINTSLLEGVFE